MSALGHKQTYAVHKAMSALPPIATLIACFGMSALGQKRTLSDFARCPQVRSSNSGRLRGAAAAVAGPGSLKMSDVP